MLTLEQMKELALHSVRGTVPANFSAEGKNVDVNGALFDAIRELVGTGDRITSFQRAKYDIFDIIITSANEYLPKKVIDIFGKFANVQTVPQGQQAIFKTRTLGKARARKFITEVAPGGLYRTFRLDSSTFTVTPKAIGGAISIDYERILDGADSMIELMEIVSTGLADAVYIEVQKALKGALNVAGVPEANRAIMNQFDSEKALKVINTVRAYSQGVPAFFAPPEFVSAMGPDAIVSVPQSGNYGGVYHPQDIDSIHNTGYINLFRGTPIIRMPQSFIDESNTKTWIDPSLAYVLPSGQEKVVNIALEGSVQVNDFVNKDRSIEIHTYVKAGVAIMTYHNWGIMNITDIEDTSYNPYGY